MNTFTYNDLTYDFPNVQLRIHSDRGVQVR
ncbi:hypothetical protein Desaci_0880 [Desulfosporosinus acidiphilus SJ4]|uniref:Uncharacterized protein n=1 Tax=Desulfosporosinus acidiphilus (strain DSM 22704 / JCM 16185 / SJ4) TaxID=646529 RepID=I4D2A8_DESAJ|nr:hypothetical protein Desaci_0880 [Desulfosporosinus acidiphilus SJ4]